MEAIHHQLVVVQPSKNPSTPSAHQDTANAVQQVTGSRMKTNTRTKFESKTWTRTWPLQVYTISTYRKRTKTDVVTSRQEPITHETKAYSVGCRWSSYRIEFVWDFGTFVSTTCSLHFPHDIDLFSTLGREVMEAFQGLHDPTWLQMLLGSRKISLRTTVYGLTLFEVRAINIS